MNKFYLIQLMRKKALLIGINYIGTSNELHGCINDVVNIKNFIKKDYDFSDDEIMLMTEVSENSKRIPTKQNIIDAIKWLVSDCDASSRLFMHYSGHGGSIKDTSGDEADGRDETIFPLDGMIVDDDLKQMLIEPLKKGARLTCIFDCCHSGTALDLRYNYKVDANPKNLRYTIDVDKHYSDSLANAVLFSGCMDNQYSADSFEQGKAQGAMTFSFLETMKKLKRKDKNPTYKNIIKNLTIFIKQRGYKQIPQLSSGKFLNLESQFNVV